VFSEGPLTISGLAVALQSGGVGDVLSLRNVDSGTVIRGTVQGDGSVRIAGP
jgi:flagella basal body P-ring formation protein FlgA